jgi:hypothetical protein
MGLIARLTNRGFGLAAFSMLLVVGLAGCCCTKPVSAPCGVEAPCAPVVAAAPCSPEPAPMVAGDSGRPPHAKPGEAWCRVWREPVHETVSETVLVEPAKTSTIWIPPEYGSRMKIVCVAPAQVRDVTVPGVWGTRKRDVIDCPPQEIWERTNCGGDPCNPQECVVGRVTPPTFKTVVERVCISPPRSELKYTPAKYKCVEERYIIKDGFSQCITEPAVYGVRERTRCVRPGGWEWVRNEDCEIPEPEPVVVATLPALEVRMEDKSASGAEQGIFGQGEEVRYELVVLSDTASQNMPDLKVTFNLPEHLEFVSGGGEGLSVTGSGQSGESSNFSLSVGQTRSLHIIAKVVSVPPGNLVQVTASVQTTDGTELAVETESTTLKASE